MKKTVILAALFLTAVAHANIAVVPTAEGCKQAQAEKNQVVMDACAQMAKGGKVNLAIPIQSGTKTSK